MSSVSTIIPDYGPAMTSITLAMVQAANERTQRETSKALNRLLKQINEFRALLRTIQQHAGSPSQRCAELSSEELDAIVSELFSREQAIAGLREQSRDISSQIEMKSREDGAGRPALLRRAANAADGMYVDVLVLLRDARWDLMAILADREPRSNGPIIANAAELRRSFEGVTP